MIRRAFHRLRRSLIAEDGAVTVDFVLMLPMVLIVFFASVEASMTQLRLTMIDRSLDMVVRDLRLGNLGRTPTHEQVRERFCETAMMIPNCVPHMMFELQVIDRNTWAGFSTPPTCIDRREPLEPDEIPLTSSSPNDIVTIRACMVFDPFFPSSKFGLRMPRDESGGVQLASISAFVNEP